VGTIDVGNNPPQVISRDEFSINTDSFYEELCEFGNKKISPVLKNILQNQNNDELYILGNWLSHELEKSSIFKKAEKVFIF
jgi:hypothetical protein